MARLLNGTTEYFEALLMQLLLENRKQTMDLKNPQKEALEIPNQEQLQLPVRD